VEEPEIKVIPGFSDRLFMSQDDKNPESESNVWASYSDLFTNVAIIFLVMFVFALIKATISQVQTAQTKITHNNELKAKLNSKDLQKSKDRIAKVEKAMDEMKNYEEVIDQKVRDLNEYAKKLQENKSVLKEIITSQEKQDSILKVAEEKLQQKEQEIEKKAKELQVTQSRIDQLNDEINRIQNESISRESNDRLQLEQKERLVKAINAELQKIKKESQLTGEELNKRLQEATSNLAKAHSEITQLNQQVNLKSTESQNLQKKLSEQLESKNKIIADKSSELSSIRQQTENLRKELESRVVNSSKELSSLKQQAEALQNELNKEKNYRGQQESLVSSLKDKLEKIDGELAQSKNSSKKLSDERFNLAKQLDSLGAQHKALLGKYGEVEKQMSGSKKRSGELEKQLKELASKAAAADSTASQWKNKYEGQLGELDKLKGQLNQSNLRFKQLAETLGKLKDAVKNGVALKLRDKFKENGLDAKVDLKTGEVVLLSGEGFNFEKGSAKISKEAKVILKKIIPIYSEVLLGDLKVYNQISTINMEGHSSPSFAGKYVPPSEFNPSAYSFNMRLSAMRASSVASFLMSHEIGDYPHKDKMKMLLQSVGMAYMRPVARDEVFRGPASLDTQEAGSNGCGPWDCYKSQRVQINFLLKDNMEEIKKIIDTNGEIK
jgi:chromosome segregation ATPase